ncbi:hypothetical protein BT63DRAFT_471358 [Microthyrium microscopicum]|uniref:Uncharacterized protein n=1 Tax=Microthyrium microscopicum TaxID=703497 RepID=A0A6A6U995_9PEZI|nr:hypothetical protein BT63DRAFT_471358 [Microthyrium microscopicum]
MGLFGPRKTKKKGTVRTAFSAVEACARTAEVTLNTVEKTAIAVQETAREIIPTVKTLATNSKYYGGFLNFVNVAGAAAQCVQAYQMGEMVRAVREIGSEMKAQTALMAPTIFADRVLKWLEYHLENTSGSHT